VVSRSDDNFDLRTDAVGLTPLIVPLQSTLETLSLDTRTRYPTKRVAKSLSGGSDRSRCAVLVH